MDVMPGYKRSEVGVIPKEWGVLPLEAIANKIMVGIASAATHAYREKGIPMFRNQNIKAGYLDDGDLLFVAPEYEVTYKNKRLRTGDLLTMRTGYPGVTAVVPAQYDSAQSFTTLITRPNQSHVDSAYLCHYLNSEGGQRFFTQSEIGGAQKNVNAGTLRGMPIPLPSVPEQRAIAAVLSDVDALLDGLDRLIAKKRDLKQAAMQQLLTGRTRLPGFHGEWEVKRLGDCLLSPPDYGINAAAVPYSDRLPTYIRITDISDDGRFRPDPRVSVESAFADQYALNTGDVVFARTGASVGKTYRYRFEDGPLVFAGFLIRVRPDPDALMSAYLAAYTTTGPYWNWVRLMSMRSGQPGINGNEYAMLPIHLPPPDEQAAVAAVLSDMDAELSALEGRRDKIRLLKQAMMQELLTGKTRLVPAGASLA
jgi:type I restriction enzyme S subunit